ncbi:MAG: alpha/beta hydrolase [Undibacterium sp.]|nr:alpha/beta hydrolase [Opitutaceae bacterium]
MPARPTSEMQAVLDELAALGGKPIATLTAKEARKQPTPADAVAKLMKKAKIKPEKVADIDNRDIDGPGGDIKIRVYTPKGDGPFPVIVYYHGGGFVIADLDVYDATPRALCNAVGAVVVSSHYRQGPEHKFPAAHDDALAAYQWTLKNAAKIKGDATRVAVVGESAGGNLAAYVSIQARDRKLPLPIYQVLVYPVTDSDMTTASYVENANAKPLNKPIMAWFFENAATPADAKDPRLAPLRADLAGLPPTTVITAQIDPLRSEGEAFAKKLTAAGVKVDYRNFNGVTHEFFGMGAVVPEAKEALDLAASDLKTAFATKVVGQ